MQETISAPSDQDIKRLALQRIRVEAIAQEHLGRGLPQDDGDLALLQEIVDGRFLGREDTYDLQCLGVVFGMRLVHSIEGLDWAIVEDQYGRDPALRYLDTSLLLFPLTMISKRVEDGAEVDVRAMFDGLRAHVEKLKNEVARPH